MNNDTAPCKGMIILPLQGEYLIIYIKTQGVAIGLNYIWLSAKKTVNSWAVKGPILIQLL